MGSPGATLKQEQVPPGAAHLACLAFALVFPTFLSWLDFVVLVRGGAEPNPLQQVAYAAGKLVQFTFPVLCVLALERRLPRPARPRFRGLGLGLLFGLFVAAGMLALYYVFLRDTALFRATPATLKEKLQQFDVATPAGFAGFAVFITFFHSLFEEYYWRWFVFGGLKRHVSSSAAILISSLGFMAHHVVVLYVYLPGQLVTGVVPFSLCVAGGGVAWAWLYDRTGSVWSPWLSHLLVDAALFVIGYDLFFVK